MKKELLVEEVQHHGKVNHEATVKMVRDMLVGMDHNIIANSDSTLGDTKTSFLLAKHPVYGESMYCIHTNQDGTSSSRVGAGGDTISDVMSPHQDSSASVAESWEDNARRLAVSMLG